jgi:anaerobic magnesium-protoporphyrin IX monomethyl ester cyclase
MKKNWMFDKSYRATNILTSRGCPYKCIYCDHSLWGNHHRQRSATNIIGELQILKDEYGITAFVTSDDTFNLNKKWVLDFCDAYRQSGLGLDWMCNCRVNHVDREMLTALRDAGCVTIGIGIESGSDRILKELGKNVTAREADNVLGMTKQMGFKVLTYLTIGSFSEDAESIAATVRLLKKHHQRGAFNFLAPIPGTMLYNIGRKKGKIQHTEDVLLKQWDKWQDNILYNLTDHLSNEDLRRLKSEAEYELGVR